jgi:hypothetical protein
LIAPQHPTRPSTQVTLPKVPHSCKAVSVFAAAPTNTGYAAAT